jgi:hypothetical protein
MTEKNPKQERKQPPEGMVSHRESGKTGITGGTDASTEGQNLGATPGSTQGGTLAGTPGLMAGGHFGTEPETPTRIPPYGTLDTTPFGTEEAILGSTTGDLSEGETGEENTDAAGINPVGSTLHGNPGSTTDYLRALRPEDLYSYNEKTEEEEF